MVDGGNESLGVAVLNLTGTALPPARRQLPAPRAPRPAPPAPRPVPPAYCTARSEQSR